MINRSPCKALETTPYEMWIGKKPFVSHLRVFGYEAYVHVPKEKWTKMDPKVDKCIFIGYDDKVKGYKLWNPLTKKSIYSRDVIFRELSIIFVPEQPKEKDKGKSVHFEIKQEDVPREEKRDGFDEEEEYEESK